MSVTLSSYDQIGKTGMDLMQKSLDAANTAAVNMASNIDPMNIAENSIEMSKAKVGMALGAYLVKTQNELMESTLQLFGIGTKCNCKL